MEPIFGVFYTDEDLDEMNDRPPESEFYSDDEDGIDDEEIKSNSMDETELEEDEVKDDESGHAEESITDTNQFTNHYSPSPNHFDVLNVIGLGNFGKVLLVRKNCGYNIGTHFAMKIIKKSKLIDNETDAIHTKTERDVLTQIRHPFIVQLHYAFQTSCKLYLVMELVHGGEMFSLLDRSGHLHESDVRFYSAQMVLALEYLHKNGIIYRDLKPENVLISKRGSIKLADFGLCKEYNGGRRLTHTFCGTIEYMAPEVITRVGHGVPADWWSFGSLVYDMLNGAPPFIGQDRQSTIEMILACDLKVSPHVSVHARNLLRSLIIKRPELRLGGIEGNSRVIKKHKFFMNIDWDDVYHERIRPPFIPELMGDDDLSHFDPVYTEAEAVDTPCVCPPMGAVDSIFKDFSFVSNSLMENIKLRSLTCGYTEMCHTDCECEQYANEYDEKISN